MDIMAVAARKVDLKIGELVEIHGKQYDVVSDKAGGVALEPAITKTVAELRSERGARPLAPGEFEELFGPVPPTGEG